LTKITIDQLLTKAKNKFMLANALSARAKQIVEGSLPYVDDFNPANPIVTAMKEIAADRIKIRLLEGGKKPETLLVEEEKPKKKLSLVKEEKKKTKTKKKK